jgi:hypothetical protein
MKTITPFVLAAVLAGGCATSSPKRVSAAEFRQQYAQVGMAQTAHAQSYLGQRDGRAYISVASMSTLADWSERTIYVPVAELDPAFRDTLPKTEMRDAK